MSSNPYGLNDFQWAMFQLDSALTGKDNRHVLNAVSNGEFKNALDYALSSREWYLSDGGYSRIVCNDEGKLRVTSNSLDRVKNTWPLCEELIAAVEEQIRRAIEEAQAA